MGSGSETNLSPPLSFLSMTKNVCPGRRSKLYVVSASKRTLTASPCRSTFCFNIDNYDDIKYLDCHNNKLINLPMLPNNLIKLYCEWNNLINLSILPNSLIILFCELNYLINLPILSNSLNILSCYNNKLNNLPILPNNLINLYCDNNKFNYLPKINKHIKICYDVYKIKFIDEYNLNVKYIKINIYIYNYNYIKF